MKINSQLTSITPQKQQQNDYLKPRFEQLLSSPTKQNSGDEYYWQHQNQLQQSGLQFKHHFLTQESSQKIDIAKPAIDKKEMHTSPLRNEPLINIPKSPINADTKKGEIKALDPLTVIIEKQLVLLSSSHPIINKIISVAQVNRAKIKNAYPMQNQGIPRYKKHHVFIEEHEMELSLNTHDLNKQEEDELKYLINNYLNKQGLSLKQLIINGVKK